MVDGNIWSASLRVCRLNLITVLSYVAGTVILAAISEYRDSNMSSLGVQAVIIAILAIPAHLTMLGDPDPKTASGRFFKERGLWTFLWRSCALAAISIVVMFVALFAAMSPGLSRGEAIALAISVLVISACIVFAVWGTMLPAIVAKDDPSFAAASTRARRTFSYALPRLFISFGLISVV